MNKSKICARMLVLALLLSVLSMSVLSAYATSVSYRHSDPLTVSIPVENKVTGNPPTDLEYTFVLEAKDGTTLPDDAGKVTIKGSGTGKFGPLTFTKVGEYRYTAYQKEQQAEKYTFDKTKFDILVVVENTGDKLAATMVVTRHGKSEKSTKLQFVNKYKTTPGERLPQTGLLWWPVYVLAGLGLMAIIVGVLVQRRKKNG